MASEAHHLHILQQLTAVSVELSAEKDHERLLEILLLEAKALAHADGGTLYLRTEDDRLAFCISRNDTLGMAFGGSSGQAPNVPPIALYDAETGKPNSSIQVVFAVLWDKPINIPDVYDADGFDFKGTRAFDEAHGYKTHSVITVPMKDHTQRVIGALQLINAKDPDTGEIVPFSQESVQLVMALASLAAITLTNKLLIQQTKDLLEAFIKVIAQAIDAKSPYTGKHCSLVPMLTDMMAEAACAATEGPFKEFQMTEEELYELHIAGWLHDCGKVVTPVHVMDKSTKLETIFDRIHLIDARFEVLKRDREIAYLKACRGPLSDMAALAAAYESDIEALEADQAFVRETNIGGEFMDDARLERLQRIAGRTCLGQPFLSDDEVMNLGIRKGTLNAEERRIMEDHMVMTQRMLESLPFPRHLARVTEYAIGHHEKMDGTGYPRGIKAGEMPVPARMMAIADVFEALTSSDRPYKKPKTLSETLKIMGFMKRDHHLDPEIFDFFLTSGTYLAFAERYLLPEQRDEVDIAALLAIAPKSVTA